MTKEGWFKYTLPEQMSNIAAEVHNFINAGHRAAEEPGSEDYSDFYFNKAISYIDIIEEDPKNRNRIRELEDCKKELVLLKAGILSESYVTKYWGSYTDACAFKQQHV